MNDNFRQIPNISKISTPASILPWQHRKRGFLLLSLVMTLAISLPASIQADEAADQYNLAVGLYKQKRWSLSSEAFGTFVEKFPEHSRIAAAKLYWGLALVKQQEHQKARDVLRNFVVEHSESKYLADAMYQLAECSYLLKDDRAAQTEFKRMLEKFPDHALAEWTLTYLGDSQLRSRLPQDALKTFEQAQKQFPSGRMQEDIQFGLARSYAALKRDQEAVTLYEKLSSNPQGTKAEQSLMNLGALYYSRKNFQKSLEIYKRFEQQFPQSKQLPVAQLNIGFGLFQLKQFQAAIPAFQKVAQAPEYALRAKYWEAQCHKAQKDYATASQRFKTLTEELSDKEKTSSVVPLIWYHWADSEQRQENLEQALKLFLHVADNWPKFQLAPNALHYATLSAFQLEDEQQTSALLERFDKQFPESGLKQRQQILRGRWLAAKGTKDNLQTAQNILAEVRDNSQRLRTKALAGLHLAHVLTQQEQADPALKILTSLISDEKNSLHPDELKDALYLAGLNQKQLEQFEPAVKSFNQYLTYYPQDERAKQVQIELLQIYALSGQKELLRSTYEKLKAGASQPVNLEGLRQTAENAYENEQWQQSLTLFTLITDLTQENPGGSDLSGLAWSQYKLGNKQAAADTFGILLKEFPEEAELAPEAGYLKAKCLEELNQPDEALTAYTEISDKWAPAEPTQQEDATETGPTSYAYLSGLSAARLAKQQQQFKVANNWYQKIVQLYPADPKLDQILDEWAMMFVENNDYTSADKIFTLLVEQRPDSLLADNARLSLAESHFLAGDTEKAKQEFQDLTNSNQADAEVKEAALYQLVNIANAEKNWQETVDQTGKFSIAYPQSEHITEVLLIRCTALFEAGDHATCEQLVTSLKEKIPVEQQPASLWLLAAEIAVHKKEYAEATELLNTFRSAASEREELAQKEYLADELTGRIAKNQAQFDAARTAFQKVLSDEEGRQTIVGAKSQLFIADTYMTQKQYEQARQEYLKVYLLHQDFPELQAPALYQTGRCDEALGEKQTAIESYQKLIQEFPDSVFKKEAEERLRLVENGQTD